MATPFLVPNLSGAPGALTRHRLNPVEAYLARLGAGSRRGQRQALNAIAGFLSDVSTAQSGSLRRRLGQNSNPALVN